MKLIIDISNEAYEAFKEWHKNKVSTVEQSIIANGIPYEEKPQGDLISREALKKYARVVFDKDLGRLRVVDVSDIDNAPSVSDRYAEGYAQGYIDGSTGADWKGGAENG